MKILVGYDGYNVAKEALRLAKTHAKAFGAEVLVVTSKKQSRESVHPKIEDAENNLATAVKDFSTEEKFARIESGKWLGKVFAPVNGELAGVNLELESNPGLINEDCYGKGWLFKINPAEIGELNHLIHGAEAIKKWILAEIEKYADAKK